LIVEATNCNRTFAAKQASLAADFVSAVIDFKDSSIAAIQMIWTGGADVDGVFTIYGSLIPDLASFEGCEIEGANITMDGDAAHARLWSRGSGTVTFRYALVKYRAGGTTAGTVDIIAMGKKA
jgi:hypothetical protein